MSRTAATPPTEPDFGYLLALAFQAYADELHAGLAEQGFGELRPSFGLVFRALDAEPLTLTELAARLGVSKQAAAKLVSELRRRRFVEQRAGEDDQRTRTLMLSTRGRALVRAARQISAEAEQRLQRELGATTVNALRRALTALAASGEARRAESPGRARPVW